MNLPVLADFRVIDESEDWLVVDKPAPLIVHPANRREEPTLLGGVQCLLAYERENGASPAIVNRLDRDTSGLVIIAKHRQSARELGILFERREVKKEYLAIVHGWPVRTEWVVDEPLLRAGELGESAIWVRQMVHPAGKPCRTAFHAETPFVRGGRKYAVVRCFPETGRMHQIRVHLAHAGHPIVGDKIYSGDGSAYIEWMARGWSEEMEGRLMLHRHALHAARLGLSWRGEWRAWSAPMSGDLTGFIAGEERLANPDVVIWNRDP